MTARPTADAAARAPGRLVATAALAALFVALLLTISAAAPYLFRVSTLQSEVAEQLRLTLGLTLTRGEKVRFDLLPVPHVVMKALRIDDPTGTLALDAESLEGDVRLLPLIVGRVELTAVSLTRPKLVIDLDGRPMQPDSTMGRAIRRGDAQPGDAGGEDRSERLGIVTLIDGTATLKGGGLAKLLPRLDDINVTVDWRNLASAATVSGSLTVSGTPAETTLWLAQPSRLMRGERSALTLSIHSAPLDLNANGDLSDVKAASFRGKITAGAPDLSGLLERLGVGTSLPAPFANFTMESDAAVVLTRGARATLDLPNLRVHADGNDYEGTLAYEGASHTLAGTLAIDQLNLAPFLAEAPRPHAGDGPWSTTPFRRAALANAADPIDLDLRVSAAHVRAAALSFDDAAFAVMTRGERTEVGLLEAKAYGGALRGRMSFGSGPDGLDMRAAATLTGADAATLGWDLVGRQVATGTVGGALNVETRGTSSAALVAGLHGTARLTAADGDISGVDLPRGLSGARRVPGGPLAAIEGGRTPYASAALDTRIAEGVATIAAASVRSPQMVVTATGHADLATTTLDVRAAIAAAGAANPAIRLALSGHFGKILVSREADKTP